ncbi:MAG: MFS transporter [Leptospirales bacterium]
MSSPFADDDAVAVRSETKTKGRRDPRRMLARGLVLAVTLHAFEQIAVVAILEDVVRDLDGRDFSGIIFGVYLLASILASVISGGYIDRRGPAGAFLFGLACFTTGLAGATIAWNVELFIFARAIQGAGGGLLLTVAYAAVNMAYDEDERPRILAALSMAWIVPGLLGPPIAAALASLPFLAWRWVFAVLLPCAPVVAIFAAPALGFYAKSKESPTASRPAGTVPRVWLALVLCAGAGLLQYGSVQARPLVLVPALLFGGGMTLFALLRLMPPGTLWLRPVLPAAIALKLGSHFAFFGTDSFIPFALQEVRDASLFYASLAIAPSALTWAAASVLVARLNDNGRRYMAFVRGGFAALALGIALALPVLRPEIPTALAFIAWAIAGFGVGLAYLSLNAIAMNQTENDTAVARTVGTALDRANDTAVARAGHTAVALNIADSLGFAFGSTATGAILFHGARAGFSTADQFSLAWTLNLGVAVLSMLAAGRLIQRRAANPKTAKDQ